jgi:hypothetical protein
VPRVLDVLPRLVDPHGKGELQEHDENWKHQLGGKREGGMIGESPPDHELSRRGQQEDVNANRRNGGEKIDGVGGAESGARSTLGFGFLFFEAIPLVPQPKRLPRLVDALLAEILNVLRGWNVFRHGFGSVL